MRKAKAQQVNRATHDLNKPSCQVELTVEAVNRLDSNCWYEQEEIAGVAEFLFGQHHEHYNFSKQFEVVGGVDQLTLFLEKPERDQNRVFIIFNKGGNHWVVFCMIKVEDSIYVLYKDSFGVPIASDIKNCLCEHDTNISIRTHTGHEQQDGSSCGPMSLKNLKIMLDCLKNDQSRFIEDFVRTQFCGQDEVPEVKRWFKSMMQKQLNDKLDQHLADLTGDTEFEAFKMAINKIVDDALEYLPVMHSFDGYRQILEDELIKLDKDPNYEIDEQAINAKKTIFMDEPKIKGLMEEQAYKGTSGGTDIEKKYAKQMEKFTKIFGMLANSRVDDKLDNALRQISQQLGMDYAKVKKFFELKVQRQKSPQNPNTEDSMTALSLDDITKKLSKLHIGELSFKFEKTTEKTLEKIISELQFEEDNIKFKDGYERVQELYEKWKEADLQQIKSWSASKRGNLQANEIYETIAVMDRANELVTQGHRLRIPQILSVLAFLRADGRQGQLCQIQTGEGKTTIVSLLATIKVLQGAQVDIITSNQVLANEGLKSRSLFYGLLGICVATNNADENYQKGRRACYTADVVYGSIGNFQFDYLRDSFEGLETRSGRKFDYVIMDEVDSMLIDNGGHIAKLAGPFPGMDALKYVYIKIWQELYKAEREMSAEFEVLADQKIEELTNLYDGTEQVEEKFEEFRQEVLLTTKDKLKERIKATNPANIELIPRHLSKYALGMTDKWIDNAIYAKYQCNENEQYVVKEKDGENVIVPVDHENTGVTLRNTIWSDGLHQFVQLKHNFQLTAESLTTSFISNVGYIKLYSSTKIYGLTGTLGSTAEQELLSLAYNVGFARIPTYMPKKFQEVEGRIVEDEKWTSLVALKAAKLALRGRSVLIICKTIKDLQDVEENIKALKKYVGFSAMRIATYPDEDRATIVERVIDQREVIISTNIAGRGTDFKTSQRLEENGGLHVCISFLPVNQRVEDQAFGRTSRQQNSGTAQLIIRESDLLELEFENLVHEKFSRVKEKRDDIEKKRLEQIKNEELVVIGFQDVLFEKFSNLYKDFQSEVMIDPIRLYLTKDLKEHWAFWLHNKSYKYSTVKGTSIEKEFKEFQKSAKPILDGKISHNPYYSISEAELHLNKGHINQAKVALEHAITLAGDNSRLLYSAHIKQFEVAIEQGRQIRERYAKAVKEIIFLDFFTNIQKDESYKENARIALERAKAALDAEIKYIGTHFIGEIREGDDVEVSNPDFVNILTGDDNNFLMKHIESRLLTLNYFQQSIDCLLEDIKNCPKEQGLAIRTRVPNYLNVIASQDEHFKNTITEAELTELGSVGMETTYLLREVHDIPSTVVRAAQGQILAGISAYATGAAFPPLLPLVSPIGGALISEGVCDLVVELANPGDDGFNSSAFVKSKCISYGIAIATLGIGALIKSTKILDKAIKACKDLIKFLEQYPKLQKTFQNLIYILEKVVVVLEKYKKYVEKLEKFRQVEKVQKGASQMKSVMAVFRSAGTQVAERAVYKYFEKFLRFRPKPKPRTPKSPAPDKPTSEPSPEVSLDEDSDEELETEVAEKAKTQTQNWDFAENDVFYESAVKEATKTEVRTKPKVGGRKRIKTEERRSESDESSSSDEEEPEITLLINVRSLKKNLAALNACLLKEQPHIGLLSEVRSKDDCTDSDNAILLGYNTVITETETGHTGGTAIAVRQDNATLSTETPAPVRGNRNDREDVDIIWQTSACVQLKSGSKSFTAIYRSPSGNKDVFLDYFGDVLMNKAFEGGIQSIGGDFNIDVKRMRSRHVRRLLGMAAFYGFRQLVWQPTREAQRSSTIIDLVFTNEVKVCKVIILTGENISDHNVVKVKVSPSKPFAGSFL